MNSIPYEFTHHVFEHFHFNKDDFADFAPKLANPWRDAAVSHLSHRRCYFIQIEQISEDLWAYGFFQAETPPIEVILRMDRRYVRFGYVSVGSAISDFTNSRLISSRDLFVRLIPFVSSLTTPNSCVSLKSEAEDRVLGLFEKYGHFQDLHLGYGSPGTEKFLGKQLKQNLSLTRLTLCGSWPEIDDNLVEFIKSENFEKLDLGQTDLKVTFSIFKTLFDLWLTAKPKKKITVRGPRGISQAQIVDYCSRFCAFSHCSPCFVQWKRANSSFCCLISDYVVVLIE